MQRGRDADGGRTRLFRLRLYRLARRAAVRDGAMGAKRANKTQRNALLRRTA